MKLTKEEILKRISQQAIWERYFPWRIKTSKSYRNPLRTDKSPGCRFYTNRKGIMYFHDFSEGKMWNCFDWVQEQYFCSFFEALKIINQDFGLGLGYYKKDEKQKRKVSKMGITNQKIKIDPPERKWEITQTEFTEKDYEYWKSFGINADILAFYNVLKADNVYYNGDFYSQSEEDDPVYVYHFIKWDRLKIYRPLTKLKRDKWKGYCTFEVLQGYEQLPETGDLLIITKSLKDVMTLHSLGYAAVAPSGENVIIREEQMKELRERFKKVILLFDNDGSFTDKRKGKGKYATRNYVEEYDIPYTFIPEDKAKDISDFYKAYGRRESQSLMKQIVKNATLSREWI